MIRTWSSDIVPNVTAILNTVRIICSHIHMSNDSSEKRLLSGQPQIIIAGGRRNDEEDKNHMYAWTEDR